MVNTSKWQNEAALSSSQNPTKRRISRQLTRTSPELRGKYENWECGNCCLQTEIYASDGKTNTLLLQEYAAVPAGKAFQKRTASRFQHDSSPEEGDAPIKIQRPRSPTFPKIHSLKWGKGRSRRKILRWREQVHKKRTQRKSNV